MSAAPLAGQVAMITGAGAGIGAACAERLAADGASIVLMDLSATAVERAAGELRSAGATVRTVVGDAAEEDDVDRAFAAADDLGPLDVLVAAAGGFTTAPDVTELSRADWDLAVALNLTSAFLAVSRAVTRMRAHRYGRIALVSSMAGRTGLADISLPYSAAKAALAGLARRLALDVAGDGVTVNVVAPGVVLSPRVARLHADRLDALNAITPVGRAGQPEEIAHAVAYLTAPLAGFVTGTVMDVNGGRWMG